MAESFMWRQASDFASCRPSLELRASGSTFTAMSQTSHIHIDRGEASAKVWLEPVALARNLGFRPNELTRIIALVREHRGQLLEAWDEHFGRSR